MTRWQARRAVLRGDFGRDAGWDLLRDGQLVASLSDVVRLDMFWHSYRLVPWTPELLEPSPWTDEHVELRSKLTGERVRGWWTAPHADAVTQRVCVRGLVLSLGWPWARMPMWLVRALHICAR